jgi:hypothetical protein
LADVGKRKNSPSKKKSLKNVTCKDLGQIQNNLKKKKNPVKDALGSMCYGISLFTIQRK